MLTSHFVPSCILCVRVIDFVNQMQRSKEKETKKKKRRQNLKMHEKNMRKIDEDWKTAWNQKNVIKAIITFDWPDILSVKRKPKCMQAQHQVIWLLKCVFICIVYCASPAERIKKTMHFGNSIELLFLFFFPFGYCVCVCVRLGWAYFSFFLSFISFSRSLGVLPFFRNSCDRKR